MKIVIVGGTGQIGRPVASQLEALGHEVVIASPSRGVNTVTGEGLERSLVGADVVVDVSNSPSLEDQAAAEFFTRSAQNIAGSAVKAGVKHLIALSIVGTERISGSGYFVGKAAQERAFQESGIPYSILRATQFHEFVEVIAGYSTQGGIVHMPTTAFQPVAVADVVAEVLRLTLGAPGQGVLEIAGPERRPMSEFVALFLAERGDSRQVLADPALGYLGIAVDATSLVPIGPARLGRIPFHTWQRSQAEALVGASR